MACLSLFLFALTSPAMSLSPSTTAACLCRSTNSSKLSCTKPLSRTITYNIHVLFSHLTLSTLSLLAALAAAWSAIWFWTCWYTRSLRCSCFLLSDCKHVTCHLSTWNTYGTTCVTKCLHVIKTHSQTTYWWKPCLLLWLGNDSFLVRILPHIVPEHIPIFSGPVLQNNQHYIY